MFPAISLFILKATTATPAATVTATIKNSTIKAGGDLTLRAISEAQLNATVGNEATSAAQGVINAAGAAGSGVLASNMVSSTAQAWIDSSTTGSITVGGALSLTADDQAGIDASAKLVANSSAQSDGGVSIVNNILNQLLDERHVRGVIALYPKFADAYLAEYIGLAELFRARGLPALLLEDDGESGFSGQQRTRVEAFLEVLA